MKRDRLNLVALLSLTAVVASACQRHTGLVRNTEPETPVEDRGPMSVRVVESWKTDVHADFGHVAGMATWPEGTIWVGDGKNAEVWELRSDGSHPRQVTWSGPGSGQVEEVNGIAVASDSAFLILGRDRLVQGRKDGSEVRHLDLPPLQTWSFATLRDGGFVVGGGAYPGDAHYGHAVHRFDDRGTLTASWHPGFEHEDWRVANYLTGAVLGLSDSGDLLVSDLAPFRITRYVGIDPARPALIVEDEKVISSSELTRATAPNNPGTLYQFRWNRSRFVGETTDGNILNVALYYSNRRGRPYSLWTVTTWDGVILASTRHDKAYRVWGRVSANGAYLASYDGYAMSLSVSLVRATSSVRTGIGSWHGGK